MVKKAEKPMAAADMESSYKGVRKRKWGKWVSEIRLPNSRERIWLGSYDTPEKAARAFDAAVFCLRGRNAKFNFPNSPPEISGGESLAPAEIQAVAARFANEAPELSREDPMPSSELSSPSSGTDTGAPAESELTMDWDFLQSLEECRTEFGSFPVGFDDFAGEFFGPAAEPDFGVDNGGGMFSQSTSFLWSF